MDFSKNKIKTIEEGTFNLPLLKFINISDNCLEQDFVTTIPENCEYSAENLSPKNCESY